MATNGYHCRACGLHLPTRLRAFTANVLAERARLALSDPEGEKLAVHPLSEAQAARILRHLSDCMEPRLRRPAPIGTSLDQRAILNQLGCDPDKNMGMVRCPGPLHQRGDRNASLSWKWDGEKALLHCMTGCSFAEIKAALR